MSIIGGSVTRRGSRAGNGRRGTGPSDPFRIVDELEFFDRVRIAELLRLFQPADLVELLKTVDRIVCSEVKVIKRAHAEHDVETLKSSLHKIRGMAGNYGLEPLAEISHALESQLIQDSATDVSDDIDRFLVLAQGACREIGYLLESL